MNTNEFGWSRIPSEDGPREAGSSPPTWPDGTVAPQRAGTAPVPPYPPPRSVTVLTIAEQTPLGIRLDPPPAGVAVDLDAHEAYQIVKDQRRCPRDNGPVITLAVATTDHRAREEAGATHISPIDNRLVHALRWENFRWQPSGGPAPKPGQTHTENGPADGTLWIFVDAHSGDIVLHRMNGSRRTDVRPPAQPRPINTTT